MRAYRGWDSALDAFNRVRAMRVEVGQEVRGAGDSVAARLRELDGRLGALEGAGRRGPRGMRGAASGIVSFSQLQGQYATVLSLVEDADLPSTTQAIDGLRVTEAADKKARAEWAAIMHQIKTDIAKP
jgi:hypothetical protein